MSLRRAAPAKFGARPHRIELIKPPRPVRARIDGQWLTADATCWMQQRADGPWEVCLTYAAEPGQNTIGWFVADQDNLRDDDAGASD